MKSALHQLILLGFIAQALSSENNYILLCSILLWVVGLKLRSEKVGKHPLTEPALLLLGSLGGYLLQFIGLNVHFFPGYGLMLLQAGRLSRPLPRRDQIFSLVIALLHVAVGCSVVLDYRFIPFIIATLALIPRTLTELEAERFGGILPVGRRKLGWAQVFVITAVMLAFFLGFPRAFVGAPVQNPKGAGDEGSLADLILDSARGGFRQSSKVLLQIEGERMGYLRCFSLVNFDGLKWTPDPQPPLLPLATAPLADLGKYRYRWVRAKNAAYLGKLIPADGPVVQLRGSFFAYPNQTVHGDIRVGEMWNTPNNRYEFWISDAPDRRELTRSQTRVYTNHPPLSPRLAAWLDARVARATNSLQAARAIETFLRDQFTYKLGAPDLNRLDPTEDFIFNQREGHCERFASTLGFLLRARGIPSRVVMGYVPTRRDPFSGWFNIRFKDAHAWTEGYFPGIGWLILDATPRARIASSGGDWSDWLADLDFAWYSHVVNFDNSTRSRLLSSTAEAAGRLIDRGRGHWAAWTGLALIVAGGLALLRVRRASPRTKSAARRQQLPAHAYGELLRWLARHHFEKTPAQTPWEFLAVLRQDSRVAPAVLAEVECITAGFCRSRYGQEELSPFEEAELDGALKRLFALDSATVSKPL